MRGTRDELLADIYRAFADVTREGGVSWSETEAVDDYAGTAAREAARELDKDTCWQSLVDDPRWKPDYGCPPGFSFLDPIGFRYYLAAGMVRFLLEHEHLPMLEFQLAIRDEFREHTLRKLSLLTPEQRACVARFVEYMMKSEFKYGESGQYDSWKETWDSYWKDIHPPTA